MAHSPSPLPGPDAELDQHLDAIATGQDGSVEGYIRALAQRDLWVGAAQLPPGAHPGVPWTAPTAVGVALLSTTLPSGGGKALQLFSTEAGVHQRNPAAVPVKMAGTDALALVVRDYDGAIVDSHARWQGLAAEWITQALA